MAQPTVKDFEERLNDSKNSQKKIRIINAIISGSCLVAGVVCGFATMGVAQWLIPALGFCGIVLSNRATFELDKHFAVEQQALKNNIQNVTGKLKEEKFVKQDEKTAEKTEQTKVQETTQENQNEETLSL